MAITDVLDPFKVFDARRDADLSVRSVEATSRCRGVIRGVGRCSELGWAEIGGSDYCYDHASERLTASITQALDVIERLKRKGET